MEKQTKAEELAYRILKADRDLSFKRINDAQRSQEVKAVYDEAKLLNISVNHIGNLLMQNCSTYEKELEKRTGQAYSIDFKPAA